MEDPLYFLHGVMEEAFVAVPTLHPLDPTSAWAVTGGTVPDFLMAIQEVPVQQASTPLTTGLQVVELRLALQQARPVRQDLFV